jgi:hypothetical protein
MVVGEPDGAAAGGHDKQGGQEQQAHALEQLGVRVKLFHLINLINSSEIGL